MDGIVVIDKPAGMTSAAVVARVKKATGVKKAGHTGTLDPFATGVLVLCLGRATRLARFFLHGEKGYEAVLKLGEETDTQDLTGEVVRESPVPELSEADVRAVLARFEGEIEQVPPVYSALKHEGVPLYKLARAGKPVRKPPRAVTVHELRFLSMEGPLVRFHTRCSGGTYIRTLSEDIGRELGCGAHLRELRRTANSGFSIDSALPLDEFLAEAAAGRTREHLIPMADALLKMPEVTADKPLLHKIRNGSELTVHDLGWKPREAEARTDEIKVIDSGRNLLAVLEPKKDGTGLNYLCVFPVSAGPSGRGAAFKGIQKTGRF